MEAGRPGEQFCFSTQGQQPPRAVQCHVVLLATLDQRLALNFKTLQSYWLVKSPKYLKVNASGKWEAVCARHNASWTLIKTSHAGRQHESVHLL